MCMLSNSPSGGSSAISLCHSLEAARLLITSTFLLHDKCGNSQVHLEIELTPSSACPPNSSDQNMTF